MGLALVGQLSFGFELTLLGCSALASKISIEKNNKIIKKRRTLDNFIIKK